MSDDLTGRIGDMDQMRMLDGRAPAIAAAGADPLATFDLFGEKVRPAADAVLKQRFVFPPFSVLSARDGDWQERKRAWLLIGIKSEVGRGGNLLKFSESAQIGGMDRKNAEAASGGYGESQSAAGLAFGAQHPDRAAGAGTSVFDPVLCELAYRWFCPPGGAVIDPFAGGSVRGVVASALGRRYFGVDLRAEQIAANLAQISICSDPLPEWACGDSRFIDHHAGGRRFDFLFSCPPYADLERYSDDPADLSTLPYEKFRADYAAIIARAADLLQPDSFACFVVGDVRGRDGNYYNFPGDTIAAFRSAGMAFYNEAILVTSVGSLPVRINAQFRSSRKLGKTHQNVLVFLKGDAKRAAAKCEIMGQQSLGVADGQ